MCVGGGEVTANLAQGQEQGAHMEWVVASCSHSLACRLPIPFFAAQCAASSGQVQIMISMYMCTVSGVFQNVIRCHQNHDF